MDLVDIISPDDLGSSGTKPLLCYYGWPFRYEQALEYAKRCHLLFHIMDVREYFEGKSEMDFADLPEKFSSRSQASHRNAETRSNHRMQSLAQSSGLPLDIGYLLSKDFDGVLYVWDNYNIDEQFDLAELFGTWDDGVKIIGKAMDEMTGQSSKLQWWHSWLNRQRLRA